MKKLIAMLLCATLLTVPVYADFDYSSLDGLSKDDLLEIQNEITNRINIIDAKGDTNIDQHNLIEFEDKELLLKSRLNRKAISDALEECRTEELKSSLLEYNKAHEDSDADEILNILNSYGDYNGIESEVDYFNNNETIYYKGYREIDESHYFRIYYFGGDFIEFGIARNKRMFTTSAELRIIGQGNSWDGIRILEKYGFNDQKTESGIYIEKAHEHLHDSDLDYLLNDMSGQVVIRFTGKNETFDYELNDEDKKALQNMAKYLKTKNLIRGIMLNAGTAE